jgi:phospholipase/lecithinase/hemolysin
MWAELVRDRLGLPAGRYANHAVGGAFSGRGNLVSVLAPGTPVAQHLAQTGVLDQVDAYLAAGGRPEPDTVIALWVGDNDYAVIPGVDPGAVGVTLANIETALRRLAAAGGRHFLVATIDQALVFPGDRAGDFYLVVHANAADHNARLGPLLARLRRELGVELVLFDTAAVTAAVAADPARYGFTETAAPCYAGLVFVHGPACAEPDRHVFWDDDHVTAAVQALLADAALCALRR